MIRGQLGNLHFLNHVNGRLKEQESNTEAETNSLLTSFSSKNSCCLSLLNERA